ncbi:MAG: YvcK family protein [Alicyclobacillaceae bacterium]|nr:YvcK family protein [Alicyclobacillaceae bacterium]
MERVWWTWGWGIAAFGFGFLLAGGREGPAGRPVFGLACLVFGLTVLVLGWWWEKRRQLRERFVPFSRPRVVVIGGGTGQSVLLRGLKRYDIDITAVVTVADDGGSSGRLRSAFGMPPPGDIRNCLVALADTEPLMERLWQHRFQGSDDGLAGHSFGNLFIAAMSDVTGDFETAVREASRVLAVRGRVLPAARRAVVLRGILDDGREVTGESRLPQAGGRIVRVAISPPDAEAPEEVVEAIEKADVIVVGPGSLFTSILPNLLVPRVSEAIRRSRAWKIYVCNVMTQPGETDGFSASDHVRAVYEHTGFPFFDYAVVHTAPVPEEALRRYREEGAHPVAADIPELERMGIRVITGDFLRLDRYARHDADKISRRIVRLARRAKRSWRRRLRG